VEDALRSVGQTFSGLGLPDPRITSTGKIDFRLQRMLSSYKKDDPPPHRVKPIPVQVLRHIMTAAHAAPTPGNLAIADMCCLAFFFLLRPGEYTIYPSDSTPFRLCDIQLRIGNRRLDSLLATEAELRSANFASLTFTTQKNGVRGEVIGLSRSGSPHFCPVLSLVNRLLHARAHNANLEEPIAQYYQNAQWHSVTPGDITTALRTAVTILGPTLGFLASDVSAKSLRASGAMALFCAKVDSDTIRLIGRWRSDEMLRYLHVQAEPVMRHLSPLMLHQGSFVLHPNDDVPYY
jgi:nitroreductase